MTHSFPTRRSSDLIADEEGLLTVAVVPGRHPSTIVQPDELPRLLTDLPQRFDLLEAEGVDVVYVLRFDEEQSLQPAEAFVREVVVGHIGARVQLGGEDFHFEIGRASCRERVLQYV